MIFRTLISLILFCFALVAQAEMHEELKGKFAATLFVTDKDVHTPIQWMRRTEKSVGIVKLTGCTEDTAGQCDIVGDIQIFNPKGKLEVEMKDVELWKKKSPLPGELVVGAVFGISLAPNDPIGLYKIKATVRDRVNGQMIELNTTLNISK
jgi:hypothetical protein